MSIRKLFVAAFIAPALICYAHEAHAIYYVSFANGAWNVPGNWSDDFGGSAAAAFPGPSDDADIGLIGAHTITLDSSRAINAGTLRAGSALDLNGFTLDTTFSFDVIGTVIGAGNITPGSGDGLGAYGGGSITQAYFTVDPANGINFWGGGSGLFSMAHGTADRFQVFSDNPGEVFRVLQTAGQTDGLALTSTSYVLGGYSNTVIDLVFDGGSIAGDWALRVEGDQVLGLQALNTAGRLTWSGAAGISVFYDAGLDQTFVGIQAAAATGTPEPSTFILAAMSVAALGLTGRRRKRD
jgi:hypothetical protein